MLAIVVELVAVALERGKTDVLNRYDVHVERLGNRLCLILFRVQSDAATCGRREIHIYF